MDNPDQTSSNFGPYSSRFIELPPELLIEIINSVEKQALYSLRFVSKAISSIATKVLYSDWTFDVGRSQEDGIRRMQNLPEELYKGMTGVKITSRLCVPEVHIEFSFNRSPEIPTSRVDCWCLPPYEDGSSHRCWYPVDPAKKAQCRFLLKYMPRYIGKFLDTTAEFLKTAGKHIKTLDFYVERMAGQVVHANIFVCAFARCLIILLNRVLPYMLALQRVAISAEDTGLMEYLSRLRHSNMYIPRRPDLETIGRMYFPWFVRQPYEDELQQLVANHCPVDDFRFHPLIQNCEVIDEKGSERPLLNHTITAVDDGSGQPLNIQMARNGVLCGPWRLSSVDIGRRASVFSGLVDITPPLMPVRLAIVNQCVDLYNLVRIIGSDMAVILTNLELTNVSGYKIFPETPWPIVEGGFPYNVEYRFGTQNFHSLFDAISDAAVGLVDLRISEIGYRNYPMEYSMDLPENMWPRQERKMQPKPEGFPYHRPFYTRDREDINAFSSMRDVLNLRREDNGLEEDPWLNFCRSEDFVQDLLSLSEKLYE